MTTFDPAARWKARLCVLAMVALLGRQARAQMPWVPFGARSFALGGASVALVDGAASVLDNPAAVEEKRLAVAVSLGGLGTENGSFLDPLRQLSGITPASLASGNFPLTAGNVVAALKTLNEPGNGLLGDARTGLVVSSGGWAFSYSVTGWSGAEGRIDLVHVQPTLDPATSFLKNTSSAAFRGLEVKDLALSRALTLLHGHFTLGATVHYLRGTTFTKEESVFLTDVTDAYKMAQRGFSGVERTSERFAVDGGVLVEVGPLKAGGVIKAVNAPVFPFSEVDGPVPDRGGAIGYGKQGRVGAAVKIPVVGLLFAADLDVTTNQTLVDGLKSRNLAGGVEWTFVLLAIRAGAFVNLEAPGRKPVFSVGVGVGRNTPLKVDLGISYTTGKSTLGGVLSARFGI
jgi:hypothetical protein